MQNATRAALTALFLFIELGLMLKIMPISVSESEFCSTKPPLETTQNTNVIEPYTEVETVETTSIDNAINMMNVYLAKQVNLAHCKVIVFSKEIAKQGIFNHVANFLNIPQVRPTCNLVISDNAPDKYLQSST